MLDFPITELMDESLCLLWLERHIHPSGFVCPHCASPDRRLFRVQGFFAAYRCRQCDGYQTLLTGTVFAGSRQAPSTLVMLLRGFTKGESSARLSRELHLNYKTVLGLRHEIQSHVNERAPTDPMIGSAFKVDEVSQKAGEKKYAAS